MMTVTPQLGNLMYESTQYCISDYNYLVNRQFNYYICLIKKRKMLNRVLIGVKFYVMFDKDVFKQS